MPMIQHMVYFINKNKLVISMFVAILTIACTVEAAGASRQYSTISFTSDGFGDMEVVEGSVGKDNTGWQVKKNVDIKLKFKPKYSNEELLSVSVNGKSFSTDSYEINIGAVRGDILVRAVFGIPVYLQLFSNSGGEIFVNHVKVHSNKNNTYKVKRGSDVLVSLVPFKGHKLFFTTLDGRYHKPRISQSVGYINLYRIEEPHKILVSFKRKYQNYFFTDDDILNLCLRKSLPKGVSSANWISYVAELESLNCNVNGMKRLDGIGSLINLKKINIVGKNYIHNISMLSNLQNLEELKIFDNYVEDITSLKNLKSLRVVDLGKNIIKDISPLRGLNNIEYLNLRNNNISDIAPLEDVINLRFLDVSGNKIHDISFLKKLHLPRLNHGG